MDLGTNTFHLLIADYSSSGFNEILHEEDAVKLGEGGINKGSILPAAFARGIKTMDRFGQLIKNNSYAIKFCDSTVLTLSRYTFRTI